MVLDEDCDNANETMSFGYVFDVVSAFQIERDIRDEHVLDVKMSSLVLYNCLCHALRSGKLGALKAIDVVISYSDVIEETTLMKMRIEDDEQRYKNQITYKFINGPDAEVSGFPYAAVAYTRMKSNGDTENVTALENFRHKDNIIKEYAIELATKMYHVYCESRLTEEGIKEAWGRYQKTQEKKNKRRRKKEEGRRRAKRIEYERTTAKRKANRIACEELMKKRSKSVGKNDA